MAMERKAARPERDVEAGVSGMDDEMEIEETGATLDSDMPPDAVSARGNSKSVTASTEVEKADVPESAVHTSQSQEPVEATSSGGVTSEAPPPPLPPTTADESCEEVTESQAEIEESNDMDVSDGEKHREENQNGDGVALHENEQLALQGEEEREECPSSEAGVGDADGAQNEGDDQHMTDSDDDSYIEVVADTCTSENKSK